MENLKHTLVALVEDKPGVLNRIASLFRRRGFNIESIAVGSSETPGISRVTLVVSGAATTVENQPVYLVCAGTGDTSVGTATTVTCKVTYVIHQTGF